MIEELLRKLPLFAALEDEDLRRLAAGTRRINLAPGEVLMTEGEPAAAAYLIIDGAFEVTRWTGDREFVIDRRGPGELVGEMALLEDARRNATVRAAGKAEILLISRETFQDILRNCPDAALSVLQTIAGRLRHTEVMLRQSEKMASLGTLAAGLAHELNNPAAAVQRAAAQLRDAVRGLERSVGEMAGLHLSTSQAARVEDLQAQLPARAIQRDARSPVERGDAEAELLEWLEALGMEDAPDVASALAASGWGSAELSELTEGFASSQVTTVARWLAFAGETHALLSELDQGATRIAEIVAAVKSYAYLDRAPIQLVDIHEGLENTLVMLRHKLRQGVEVVREYDRSLLRIEAYGSDLNQVWTNLLDNAIDAMNGRGRIRIRTYAGKTNRGEPGAVVEISDTGPGIPAAMQPRIFDAFFTTKEPGKGTGLGLHISYSIVVNKHRGEIDVQSRPGETTFKVTLPMHAG